MLCFDNENVYSEWHRKDLTKPKVKLEPEDSEEEVGEEEEEEEENKIKFEEDKMFVRIRDMLEILHP